MVIIDIMIGRMRERTASSTADLADCPRVLKFLSACSTIRIGLFTTVPISTRKPSIVIRSNGWVKAAKGDEEISETTTAEDEKEELRRLRKEVKTLRMERDFLKKATAFFARDSELSS